MYRTSATSFTTVPIAAWKQGDFSAPAKTPRRPDRHLRPEHHDGKPERFRLRLRTERVPEQRDPDQPSGSRRRGCAQDPAAAQRHAINALPQTNNFYQINRNATDSNQYTARIDHRFSDKNLLFGASCSSSTTRIRWPVTSCRSKPAVRAPTTCRTRHLVISDTCTVTPRMINEFRGVLMRNHLDFKVTSADRSWPQKLGLPKRQDVFPAFESAGPA